MSPDDFNSSSILVKDIMAKALISVNPATTALQIAKMMEQGGIGAVLVKENGNLVGIVTDRDYATKIAVNNHPGDTPVDKVASYPLETIGANESILTAAGVMSSKKIRKLAVIEDDKVTGIITSTDIVNLLAK